MTQTTVNQLMQSRTEKNLYHSVKNVYQPPFKRDKTKLEGRINPENNM